MQTLVLTGALAVMLPAFSVAQQDDWCSVNDRRTDRGRFCEVREMTISATDRLHVDAGPNGSIRVEAWDRNDVHIAIRVNTRADDDDAARALAGEVSIEVDGGRISSAGPRTRDRESWSASFRLMVPRSTDLDLETTNGGIAITGVSGRLDFSTTNGGIRLDDVHGDVRGTTRNGGLDIRLTGTEWRGQGLDVTTTNGGVDLSVPRNYNARLETGTVNGGMHIDFPVTVRGRIGRNIETDLGNGGRVIRVRTRNGGVEIRET